MPTISELPSRSKTRDYSLVGLDTPRAIGSGLATAEWYHTDPAQAAQGADAALRRAGDPRHHHPRRGACWSASGGFSLWGTWWSVPFFIVYGALYGSSSRDSRWHECGHRTAFRTKWMNDVVYEIASFMMLREPDVWRWSHTRHHTDTIIVGRDPEIAVPRPPKLWEIALGLSASCRPRSISIRSSCTSAS